MEKLSRGKLFPGLPILDGTMYLYFGTYSRAARKSVLSGPWVAESQWERVREGRHENFQLNVEWPPGWDSPVSGEESNSRLWYLRKGGDP